jgi:small subunit ribosomal protein S20
VAHHASAEKRIRQRETRHARNRLVISNVRTYVKRLRAAVVQGDKGGAEGLLRAAVSRIDKAASKGVLHRRTASRTIARLSRAVAKLS